MRYAIALAGLAVAAQAGKVTLTATEEVTITSCAPTHTACPYKKPHNDWEDWSEDPKDPKVTGGWGSWDPKDPVKSTTTSAAWGTWDPKDPVKSTSTATWDPKDPVKSTSTATWDPKDPVKSTSTATWGSWDPKDPVKSTVTSTGTWADWDPAKPTVTSTSTWGQWDDAAECPQYTATAPPAWFSQLPSSVLSSLAAKWTGAPPADWCYYSYSNGVVTQTKTPVAADTASASATWSAWNGDATGTGVKGVSATGSGPIAKYTGAASANAASFVMAGAAAVAAVVLA